jgi:formate/nitrite transporter FocA (FNT family)
METNPRSTATSDDAKPPPSSDEGRRRDGGESSSDGPPAALRQPEVGTRFSAHEIHDLVRDQAEAEMERPAGDLFWSAVTAGLVIGWSFVLGAYARSLVAEPWHRAAVAAAYPVGFILVIIGRSQLFTENTLEPVIPVLERRDPRSLRRMLRLWGLVLLGNLAGALVFALLFARTAVVSHEVGTHMVQIALGALSGSFGSQLYAAVFAGWLIALTAWLVSATQMTGAQIALIWITTAPIAALDFRHSIAGAVEAFYAAASGNASWGTALGNFVVPAVLGNIIGGVLFVAVLNHRQVADKKKEQDQHSDQGD